MNLTKTITVSQLYEHIKNSNMMGYIDSEAALIRVIKKMVEHRSAVAVHFEFFKVGGRTLKVKVLVKDLEN
ncbi:hypothetical protein ES705_38322 [subsurface metagenome]